MPPNLETLSVQLIELSQKNATVLELAEEVCFLLHTYIPGGLLLTDSTGKELVRIQEDDDLLLKSYSIPIYAAGFPIGLLLLQYEEKYAELLRNAADRCLPMLTLLLRWIKDSEETERLRRVEMVKSVINALSFSELEAVIQIFHVLEGSEGLLVAGRIADQLGMTRSVVVNALRKLEGTGVIETRSLGMKGTYIHVLNPLLAEELKKLRQ